MTNKVIIVSGSPSKTSRLLSLIAYAENELQKNGNITEVLHITDLPAEDLIQARFDSIPIQQAIQHVQESDAVIFASPVYKASYTGLLKVFLDLLPQKGLEHKIVYPLFIGGTIAHLLAIDYALKPVLSVLGARHILQGVYAVDSQVRKNEEGLASLDDDLRTRFDASLRELTGVLLERHKLKQHDN